MFVNHNVFVPSPGFIAYDAIPAYCTSKHGIIGFVRSLGVSILVILSEKGMFLESVYIRIYVCFFI